MMIMTVRGAHHMHRIMRAQTYMELRHRHCQLFTYMYDTYSDTNNN